MPEIPKPLRAADASLMERITSEKGALEIHKQNRADMRFKTVLIFISFMSALAIGSSFIPSIGFQQSREFFLPIIALVFGSLAARSDNSSSTQ